MATVPARSTATSPARPSIGDLLDDQLTEFDRLLRDVRGGVRSAEQYDLLEERANRIGQGLRDAFRRGRVARG